MSATPETASTCPECGAPLRRRGARQVCPRCLLAGAVGGGEPPSSKGGGPALAPAPEAIAGDFPDLEVFRLVGVGGMGAVYEVEQRSLGRRAALKLLRADPANPEFAERFGREAKALARLDHPNIVRVFDHGERAGWAFILMEFLDGGDLAALLEREGGKLPPPRALQLATALCDALEYAHGEGVVHRDIKPANILLDAGGAAKVADFGLAKLLDAGERDFTLTTGGSSMGTPLYMAPEQRGGSAGADTRADLYSVGVVLYEMLTGGLPMGRVRAPSELAPGIDKAVDRAVLKAIEPEPGARFADAPALRAALGAKDRGKAKAAAAAAAGIAVAGLLATLLKPAPAPAPPPPERPVALTLTAADGMVLRHPDGGGAKYFGTMTGAAGETLVVGSPRSNVMLPIGGEPGEVWTYHVGRAGPRGEPARLTASEPQPADLFGANLSLAPDAATLAVAASGWRREDGGKGIVEVFELDPAGGRWRPAQTIADFPPDFEKGVWKLRVNVSATLLTVASIDYQLKGAVRIYERGGDGRWTFSAQITPPAELEITEFGAHCTLVSDAEILVSNLILAKTKAPSQEYLVVPYRRDADGRWLPREPIRPEVASTLPYFGIEPHLAGGELFVGFPGSGAKGVDGAGAVLRYRPEPRSPSGWAFAENLVVPGREAAVEGFGGRLGAAGELVAALSLRADGEERYSVITVAKRGQNGTGWDFLADLSSAGTTAPWPGRIAVGETFVAGCSAVAESPDGEKNAGEVYVFPRALFDS